MNYEEEKRCPLCAEEMDWTDQQLKPCKCGYQVCVWCWHQIMDMAEKNETEGRCPACRAPYDKDKIVGMEAKFEKVTASNAKKHKPPKAKAKAKTTEVKKDLTNIRVIQRRMAYVIGLPLSLADENLLQKREFFGQYGKVTKVSLSRMAGGAIQQFIHDTCSVYITFSKEEEAIRCIQSVHGFALEGNFLRASFGTAKYCHAWLRNMPCNNPSCLYLHTMGAEEDSFGKDEAAAVHTRSRVQQIVGATHNMHRCSGNALPPPIDESFNCNNPSEKPIFRSVSKGVTPDTATSGVHATYLPLCKDEDGDARAASKITTFVDIVGRSCSNGIEKDGNVAEDRGVENSRSDLSSVAYKKDNHFGTAHTSEILSSKFSSSSLLSDVLPMNREFKEPFREASNFWGGGRSDGTPSEEYIEEQSNLTLDSDKQMPHDPSSVVRDDFLSLDNISLKDCGSVGLTAPSLSPSSASTTSEDPRIYTWRHGESLNLSDYNLGPNAVNNSMDAASITCTRSMSDLYNERKFQSSAKSDRIYRCSNSFSNEEIVEHLRRLDDHDRTVEAQNPALEAVESSIISGIMSLDLDAGDDSLNSRPGVPGFFGQTDGQHSSSWSLYNNDQSMLSFTKQHTFVNQLCDVDSSFSDISHDLKKSSAPKDSGENKHYLSISRHHVSMAQGPTPPGFSLPSREPPPGFPACERTEQGFLSNSGTRMVKTSSFSKSHYRTPSTGNSSNNSEADIIDPAIMAVGRGKPPNGYTNSFETRSIPPSQSGAALDDNARYRLLMQQSNQDVKYPQTYMQQVPASNQGMRYSGQSGDVYSSWSDMYGISSSYMDQRQTYNPSSFTPFAQQKYTNGSLSNGYQPGLDNMNVRNDTSIAELQRNEKLGLNNCYTGYGDYMLQQGSGDLYTRVFGM
ncbi:General negative regulator of transcription C16C9.04c like [Heracleum sosnowskyi]|uniref:General negative regulator of transcription C16C9.04c like n=1 Tax=Heracleum sosnowskyi TaxID=360622 RepID=A0AAD8MR64_9APIA|nr:General negative regulator of transcription C16C9.04c like [Heracleum sosnowskyi]